MSPEAPNNQQHHSEALPYLFTAWVARAFIGAAVAFAVWAGVEFGPLAGLAALAGGVWLARAARAPMPEELRRKFD